jgi:electron transfer flavoprotein beta subunit
MRIIVCLKQIHHVFGKTGRDDRNNFISSYDEVACINPLDIAALELALGVKDSKADTKVILLSLGPIIAEADLRRCLAMGADELCQLDTDDRIDGWTKSLLLANAAKELKADLVFCGEKSMDSGSGQIGPFIAAHLGVPFISRAMDITAAETDLPVRAERNCGRGKREIVECGLPAVLSAVVGPKIPRYPSLENKRRLNREPIRKLSVGQQASPAKVISTRVFSARPRPKQVVPPDSSLPAFQRIEQLLRGSSVEKKGEMIKGSPEQQVERIISFLQENDFLEIAAKDS